MLIEELLSKGFILNHSPRKPVQKPGSRGGKGYYTDKGKWEYGTKPYPRLPRADLAYGVTKLRTPSPAPDLARAINEHFGPYLEKLIEHEEFFSTGVIKLGGEYEGNERQSNKIIDEAIEQAEEGIQPYIKPGFIPRVLGSGVEAMAIDLGDKVARIQVGGSNLARWTTSTVPNRPNFPWMLQAIDKGETKFLGWEVLPRAELVNQGWYDEGERLASDEESDVIAKDPDKEVKVRYYEKVKKHIYILYTQAKKDNYNFGDNHPGNIGYINGKPVIIDPGAIAHFDPETGVIDQKAQAINSKPPLKSRVELEDLEKTIEAHYVAIANRGYKVMDKTVMLDLEKRVETWRAVDAVTHNVEEAFPDLKDIMAKQPLVINVTSASLGDGVRGEHHQPLYEGAPNVIDINSEYSRTFMHELGHYLDSAAAILHPSGQWNYKHKLSDMYNTPIFNVVAKLKGLPEYRQWIEERPKKERNYWTRNSEVFGRFFDQYMYHKLGKPPSDSYEPYTDQELEEVGKLLEDGLQQLKLVKPVVSHAGGKVPFFDRNKYFKYDEDSMMDTKKIWEDIKTYRNKITDELGYDVGDDTNFGMGTTSEDELQILTGWHVAYHNLVALHDAMPVLSDLIEKNKVQLKVRQMVDDNRVSGMYTPSAEGAMRSTIEIGYEFPNIIQHELWHFIDDAIAPGPGEATVTDKGFRDFVASLANSETHKRFMNSLGYADRRDRMTYLSTPTELVARFFEHWISVRAGLDRPTDDANYFERWTKEDLDTYGPVLENLLKTKHILKAFNFVGTWAKAFGNDNEPDQATIGMEGGKYYIDKYGKKHYGPYGTQPAKHLKVTATEQPYIHEQALSVAPNPIPKAPPPQKTIASVVDYWMKQGPGSYKDLVQHFMKTGSKTMMSQALDQGEGTEAIKKYSEAIAKAVENQLSSVAPKAQEYQDLILYLMPLKDKLKINEVDKFNKYTNSDNLYNVALRKFTRSSYGEDKTLEQIDESELGKLAITMVNFAEINVARKLTYDERTKLQEKYLKYLQKRKQDVTKAFAATDKLFTHPVKIENFPAAPPPINSPSSDIEAKIRSEFPSYSRQDWKRKVQNDVGNRMIKLGITKEQTNEFLKITGKRPRDSTIDPRLSVADILVETWAQSADGAVPLSVAVQRLTSQVFPGARKWDTINEWNDKYGWDRATTFLQNPVFVQVASAFLYAQYENTQDYFKRFGVSELTIGRGLKTKDQMIVEASNKAEKESKDKEWGDKWVASGEWDESSWFTNPLSSWGFDPSTNSGFSGTSTVDPAGGMPSSDQPGQPVVVAIRVPVQRIIGGFFSGNGAENEHEVVLIGMQKNLDKALWGTWGTNAGGTDISRIGTSVAQALMEGQKPTGHTLNWTTPEEDFTAEFKPLLQAKGAEQGWSKFTDKQLLGEIQMLLDPFTQTGIAVGKNAAVINNDKVLEIAHKLMDKGFGIPYEEFIDKKLKTMLPLLQDATPEQKETTIPKNLITNFVNDGIIDEKHKAEAIEYLKYKLKTAKPSEQYKEAPDKMKHTTEKFLDEWSITNKNFMYNGNTPLGAVKSISKLVAEKLGNTDAEKQEAADEVYSYLMIKWGGLIDVSH